LFVRAIGETTDVVEKEMYSFTHHDEGLTLRPEGTAGAVRAYVEHGVQNHEPVSRWYYMGPMFRGERPARGRYRQFYQAGAEVFGDAGPGVDAELIDTLCRMLESLGISDLTVHVNSIGSEGTRVRYQDAVRAGLMPRKEQLSADSQRRLDTNPLRILDSKDPKDREAVLGLPPITDFLTDADRAHFEGCQAFLRALGTPFVVDPLLVRGLDYYTRTLFEIKGAKDKLGAGDTLLGGGRYDGMVKDLGGADVPAIGFAAGMERLLIASDLSAAAPPVDAFVVGMGQRALIEAAVLVRDLRAQGFVCEADTRGASLKSQMRRASASGARVALVIGDQEIDQGVVQFKDLAAHAQRPVPRADIQKELAAARAGAAS
jgi:histidyl-tRNA synthetase